MDGNILLWIQCNMRSEILTPFFKFITALGNAGAVWIFLTVLLLVFKSTRKTGLTCAVSLSSSFFVNNLILKNVIARPRPYTALSDLIVLIPYPHDLSFPSGHSAASFAVAAAIYLAMPKKYGIPALILATLIAFSRLYLGVHYPTDVIFGILSGTVIAAIAFLALKPLETRL